MNNLAQLIETYIEGIVNRRVEAALAEYPTAETVAVEKIVTHGEFQQWIENEIEEAISNHNNEYDHDDFAAKSDFPDPDDLVTEDTVNDVVRSMLRNVSIDISLN